MRVQRYTTRRYHACLCGPVLCITSGMHLFDEQLMCCAPALQYYFNPEGKRFRSRQEVHKTPCFSCSP